jgi:phosphoribosylglycinamide formyltransferase-1
MEAILSALQSKKIRNIKPALVISNRPDAPGLRVCFERFGIPTKVILSQGLKGWDYDRKIVAALHQSGVTPESGLICMAGFMRIISPEFVQRYKMRIINIHPSLLPSFPGLYAQKQAVEYGVKVSGCTIHFVDEGIDSGPIILQKAVPVLESDTTETLSARILKQEHKLYVKAIRLFAEGRIHVIGSRVAIQD